MALSTAPVSTTADPYRDSSSGPTSTTVTTFDHFSVRGSANAIHARSKKTFKSLWLGNDRTVWFARTLLGGNILKAIFVRSYAIQWPVRVLSLGPISANIFKSLDDIFWSNISKSARAAKKFSIFLTLEHVDDLGCGFRAITPPGMVLPRGAVAQLLRYSEDLEFLKLRFEEADPVSRGESIRFPRSLGPREGRWPKLRGLELETVQFHSDHGSDKNLLDFFALHAASLKHLRLANIFSDSARNKLEWLKIFVKIVNRLELESLELSSLYGQDDIKYHPNVPKWHTRFGRDEVQQSALATALLEGARGQRSGLPLVPMLSRIEGLYSEWPNLFEAFKAVRTEGDTR